MELFTLGVSPIPGANPAGEDIRTINIYEQLTKEIDKRTTLSGDGAVNWKLVITLSQEILLNHSKNILVCSYLSVGLLNTEGLKGLAAGVQIYHDILVNFWTQGLYPPRLNGRINAINWWADNVIGQLHKTAKEYWTAEEKCLLENNFSAIIAFLQENDIPEFEQLYALVNTCMSLILDSAQSVPIKDKDTVNDSMSQSADNQQLPTKELNASASILVIENDVNKSLNLVLETLLKVNGLIAKKQQLSYKVFKINRFCAWLDVDAIPPYDSELKTMIPPPDESLHQSIKIFYQDKNWLELINASEPRVTDFRFWFDLSFYVHTALAAMNQMDAANEVSYQTDLFIKRLKGIEKLLFSDGTPFATDETQKWITNFDSFDNASPNNLLDSSYSGDKKDIDELGQELVKANQMVQQNQKLEAISFLHQEIKTSANLQVKFLRMLQFCQFCTSIGNGQLVTGYINEIQETIKNHQLDSWDPLIAANAYKVILNFTKQKKIIKIEDSIINDIISRLALIDPAAAIPFLDSSS